MIEQPITVAVFVQLLALPAEALAYGSVAGLAPVTFGEPFRQYDALEGARPASSMYGYQKNAMGAEIGRTIGIVRARCKIGRTNPN